MTLSSFSLRTYQVEAIGRLRDAYKSHSRVVLVSPTGSGKTIMGAYVCAELLKRGRKVLWLAHRRELVFQAASRIVGAGVILGDTYEDAPVRVASVRTVTSRGYRPKANFVIIDECHHGVAEEYKQILESYGDVPFLGLTATPERGDGRPLGDVFDSIVVGPTVRELVRAGALVPSKVFAPSEGKDLAGDPADFVQGQTIIFHKSVAESKALAERIGAQHIDGSTPKAERDKILNDYREGRCPTICNVDVLTEGFDAPCTETLIIARPVGTPGIWLQILGRALRPYPGKTHARIVDLCGSVHRHGVPEDERAYSLSGEAISGKSGSSLSQCASCGYVWRGSAPCPSCGFHRVEVQKIKERKMRTVEGPYRAHASADERQRTLTRLRATARERGYKPGWVAVQYKIRFGVWPR